MDYVNLGRTEEGIGVIPWSPLARGLLTGSRKREGGSETTRARSDTFAHEMYDRPEDFDVADRVGALAERRGVPPARIALAWLLHQPAVSAPIVGATKMKHLEDAVAAVDVKLDELERQELEEPYRPHRVLGHD